MDYEIILTMSEGWEELLRSYDITWAVVETDTPLATTLIQKYNWQVLYEDETAVILKK